ncbi:hypothetical protein [Ruegeria halocynthiae]|uniref:hypothetical protein n=1 Tax=Ruegeria halocynthiae TaxID=985054 RepID=UPI000AED5660|nr:hypothetical protein [Ruegeria halocynthiae]
MQRSTLNAAVVWITGFVLFTAALMLAFFASPEAVRTTPPDLYNSLLLEQLPNR